MKLKKLKRQVTYVAVAGALAGVGMVGSAQAVVLNPTGLGEVLIFPYYTVRNNQATVFSVVNTTASSKAVKVRFLEAKNSQEVLDFNLYLSPNDVWAASVTATSDGAQVNVVDQSCTTPIIATALGGAGSQAFRNTLYSTDATTDHTNDRTREGYIEVIEMGVVVPTFVVVAPSTTFGGSITHIGGVLTGAKCGALTTSWAPGGILNTSAVGSVTTNTGGLMGTAHIIGLNEGTDISYEPTVLNGWSNLGSANHTNPGFVTPSLAAVSPKSSIVFNSLGGLVASSWVNQVPVDPVSALIMYSALDNEYVTATDLLAGTDWVVTFPTKRFHVTAATTLRPFTNLFTAVGSCDLVTPRIFGREEEEKVGNIDFSPAPPGGTTQLCWETNVIRFGTTGSADVLKSGGNSLAIPTTQIFTNGWMRLSFPFGTPVIPTGLDNDTNGIDDAFQVMATQVHQMTDSAGAAVNANAGAGFRYHGLPAVGFSVIRFAASGASALASYGASYSHKGERLIVPAP
jgi:hypothetical protein